MCAVQGCRIYAYAVKCCLDDSILFGVHCPAFLVACAGFYVILLPDAANVETMGHVPGSTIITSGKYSFVFDDHSSDLIPQAG